MGQERELDAVADACLAAHTAIIQHGTPEMLVMIRHLLFVVGRELAAQNALGSDEEGAGPEHAA